MDKIRILNEKKNFIRNICDEIYQINSISVREQNNRIAIIRKGIDNKSNITQEAIAIIHEIKSYMLLRQLGYVDMADDSKNEIGIDLILNLGNGEKIYIECVHCSYGKKTYEQQALDKGLKYEKNNFSERVSGNGDDVLSIFGARITSALDEKIKKIERYKTKENQDIRYNSKCPTIIYISVGEMWERMFVDGPIDVVCRVLYGYGNPIFDLKTGDLYFSSIDSIKKNENVEIPVNLFNKERYKIISGVIVSRASTFDKYNKENTKIYINPSADISFDETIFEDVCTVVRN